MLFDLGTWIATHDGDSAAFAIYKRHYSYRPYADGRREDWRNPNRFQFVGPGEHLVMVTPEYDALWVWRKFIDDSGEKGVCCSVFRNESSRLSSQMILDAEEFLPCKWPTETRLYTLVNAELTRKKRDPGRCFRKAGYCYVRTLESGLLVFAKELANG